MKHLPLGDRSVGIVCSHGGVTPEAVEAARIAQSRGSFTVTLTRGLLVIAEQGMIVDAILNGLNNQLEGVPTYALTTFALLAHNVITFFVPSSSGEAVLRGRLPQS